MQAVLWNPNKLAMCSPIQRSPDQTEYEHLLQVEASFGNLSTTIEVNNEAHLSDIVEAIYNETDVQLSHHILDK